MAELIRLGGKKTPVVMGELEDVKFNLDGTRADLPNFLKQELSWADRVIWIPLGNAMRLLKRLAWWAFLAIVAALSVIGATACYFAYQYQSGHISAYVLNGDEYQYFGRPQNFQIEQSLEIPAKKGKK